jgi:hypothetical protein
MKGNKSSPIDMESPSKIVDQRQSRSQNHDIDIQVVLLYGAESWVLIVTGTKKVTKLLPKMCEV